MKEEIKRKSSVQRERDIINKSTNQKKKKEIFFLSFSSWKSSCWVKEKKVGAKKLNENTMRIGCEEFARKGDNDNDDHDNRITQICTSFISRLERLTNGHV